ncbi:hypothetical protein CMT69_01700 [Elizabethkingia anophelis]|uniref:ERF family protein n=1 Tax=Elizabethkingia anophelis TaxID=1117645 RepID=UPI0012B2B929|nr:ERF family protein [Elizabethkingia anophelis]MDV3943649.1 hypothetical protein [Elizabethkingia anophelis]QGN24647.1 hypothetical protein GJV56_19020 [Elizabethkingia anophelis]
MDIANINLKFLKKIADITNSIGKLSKDKENPFHKSKYFDINQLVDYVRPMCAERELLLIQPIKNNKVFTQIIDLETGDMLESSLELATNSNPQNTGSAITYYRRYTLQSLLSLQADDDDGNKASGRSNNQSQKKPTDNNSKITNWLSEEKFNEALTDKVKAKSALDFYDGKTDRKGKIYGMKANYKSELEKIA